MTHTALASWLDDRNVGFLRHDLAWAAPLGVGLMLWIVPWLPLVPSATLDQGWMIGLAVACERNMAFGRELVFTYGPLSCLATWEYWPSLYGHAIAFWAVFVLLTVILLVQMRCSPLQRLLAALALIWLGLHPETSLLALPVVLVLHAADTRRPGVTAMAGIAMLAIVALTKFTLFPVCIVAAGAVCLLYLRDRPHRAIVPAALFVVSVVFAWTVLARQPLDGFADWVRGAIDISSGYAQAMTNPQGLKWKSRVHRALPFLLLLGALAVLWASAPPLRGKPGTDSGGMRRLPLPAWVFLLVVLLGLIRHASVRDDYTHLLPNFIALGALALLVAAVQVERRFVLLAVAAGCAFACNATWLPLQDRWDTAAGTNLRAVKGLLAGELPQRTLDRALAAFAASLPPPPEEIRAPGAGTFDIVTIDQYLLAAWPYERWQPRPVLQSYSAYTPVLAARNAAALASADGPRWLLVRPQTIDARWPTQDDAAVWPLLRTHFDVVGRHAGHLLLERKADAGAGGAGRVPAPSSFLPPTSGWVDVPPRPGDALYVAIDIASTPLERLRGMIWTPPVRQLAVMYEGAHAPVRFRLVPAVAASGFLLEPGLHDVDELERWLRGQPPLTPRVLRVRVLDERGEPIPARMRFGAAPSVAAGPAPAS